jgi:hypothetical protein
LSVAKVGFVTHHVKNINGDVADIITVGLFRNGEYFHLSGIIRYFIISKFMFKIKIFIGM